MNTFDFDEIELKSIESFRYEHSLVFLRGCFMNIII